MLVSGVQQSDSVIRIRIYILFLSDLLHLVWLSLKSIHFAASGIISFFFYGWVIFHCIYIPPLLYPFIIDGHLWRFLKKTKHTATIGSSNPTSGHISRENHNSKRYMHPNVHCSTIYNSQDMNDNSFNFHYIDVKTVDQRIWVINPKLHRYSGTTLVLNSSLYILSPCYFQSTILIFTIFLPTPDFALLFFIFFIYGVINLGTIIELSFPPPSLFFQSNSKSYIISPQNLPWILFIPRLTIIFHMEYQKACATYLCILQSS